MQKRKDINVGRQTGYYLLRTNYVVSIGLAGNVSFLRVEPGTVAIPKTGEGKGYLLLLSTSTRALTVLEYPTPAEAVISAIVHSGTVSVPPPSYTSLPAFGGFSPIFHRSGISFGSVLVSGKEASEISELVMKMVVAKNILLPVARNLSSSAANITVMGVKDCANDITISCLVAVANALWELPKRVALDSDGRILAGKAPARVLLQQVRKFFRAVDIEIIKRILKAVSVAAAEYIKHIHGIELPPDTLVPVNKKNIKKAFLALAEAEKIDNYLSRLIMEVVFNGKPLEIKDDVVTYRLNRVTEEDELLIRWLGCEQKGSIITCKPLRILSHLAENPEIDNLRTLLLLKAIRQTGLVKYENSQKGEHVEVSEKLFALQTLFTNNSEELGTRGSKQTGQVTETIALLNHLRTPAMLTVFDAVQLHKMLETGELKILKAAGRSRKRFHILVKGEPVVVDVDPTYNGITYIVTDKAETIGVLINLFSELSIARALLAYSEGKRLANRAFEFEATTPIGVKVVNKFDVPAKEVTITDIEFQYQQMLTYKFRFESQDVMRTASLALYYGPDTSHHIYVVAEPGENNIDFFSVADAVIDALRAIERDDTQTLERVARQVVDSLAGVTLTLSTEWEKLSEVLGARDRKGKLDVEAFINYAGLVRKIFVDQIRSSGYIEPPYTATLRGKTVSLHILGPYLGLILSRRWIRLSRKAKRRGCEVSGTEIRCESSELLDIIKSLGKTRKKPKVGQVLKVIEDTKIPVLAVFRDIIKQIMTKKNRIELTLDQLLVASQMSVFGISEDEHGKRLLDVFFSLHALQGLINEKIPRYIEFNH